MAAVGLDAIIGALQAKQCDAINSALSYTEERDQIVDYALYGLFTDVIVVEDGNPQNIRSVDDLSGKELGWVTGYATEGLEEMEQELAEKGLTTQGARWRYRIELPPDPITGKRRQATRRGFRTKREADRARREAIADLEDGTHIPPSRLTVGALARGGMAPLDQTSQR